MEKSSVYIETSVVSYLAARQPRELVAAAWQSETLSWWEKRRQDFDLCISPLVLEEVSRGDSSAAERRLDFLAGIPLLTPNDEAFDLANAMIRSLAMPRKSFDDALHVSLAAVYGIDYLLTWNCRHIDNAQAKPRIRAVCAELGHACPEICTPSELMGDTHNV